MKRTFICLLVAFVVATAGARAAQITEITVSGSGSISLPPDVATVIAVVVTTSENAGDAIAENNSHFERIIAALKQLGIARADVTMTYYNVSYNPRPPGMPANPPGEVYGYTVSRSFSVNVRRISTAGRVSDACIAAGATSIDSVNFGVSNPTVGRLEATRKAVANARNNAKAVATASGLRIVGIKSIGFSGLAPGAVPVVRVTSFKTNAPTEFDQSNVNVSVSLSAVFLAEP